MSAQHGLLGFYSTAAQLAATPKPTETEKLFQDAVAAYRTEKDGDILQRIAQCRTADELTNSLILQRSSSHMWHSNSRNRFWKATDSTVAFIDRFREPLSLVVQISMTRTLARRPKLINTALRLHGREACMGRGLFHYHSERHPPISSFEPTDERRKILKEIGDTRDRLSDLENVLQRCFERYRPFHAHAHISDLLRQSLANFYTVVVKFCFETISLLDRTGPKTFGVILKRPMKAPFERLLSEMRDADDDVHKSTTMQISVDVGG